MSLLSFDLQLSTLSLRNRRGYTLIELLITITITTILVTIGVSAYRKASDIQAIKTTTETIIATITSAQKSATSGNADCTNTNGPYLGERLTTSIGSNLLTITSICQNGSGVSRNIELGNATFATANDITFRPLNQGIDTGNTNTQYLDFTNNNSIYRIQVDRTGTIKSVGKVTQ